MVLEKSVELMLDRHLEEQNVKPPKKVCCMGGRPASLAPHSSCGEQQIVCRVYAVVWEVVSAEKTHIGNVVVGMCLEESNREEFLKSTDSPFEGICGGTENSCQLWSEL
ncbi:hypothetical protein CJ030_MR8G022188 [Morella rubra]|uniref:Uncharacterized protein n=1 Tax=Morella rubra TaxID=262757 RepID=A0A6A1UUP1_9ROSI|nr:hypothetical protein CJ030_MR8G022188 [Morella rubra]